MPWQQNVAKITTHAHYNTMDSGMVWQYSVNEFRHVQACVHKNRTQCVYMKIELRHSIVCEGASVCVCVQKDKYT